MKNKGEAQTCEIKEIGDLDLGDLNAISKFRLFSLPSGDWTLENSDWNAKNPIVSFNKNESKFDKIDDPATEIGSPSNPAALVLDMHWKYLRFTYYDRFIKGNERISIPPILLEGIADKTLNNVSLENPDIKDVQSNWVFTSSDDKKLCQCLPWIIQKKDNKKPDKKILLQFLAPDIFIETPKNKSSPERKLIKKRDLSDPNILKVPGADRLRFYDLPELWKSQNYFCRIGDGGDESTENRFEKFSDKTGSRTKPLTFCLDDIVLTANDAPLSDWKPER